MERNITRLKGCKKIREEGWAEEIIRDESESYLLP